MTEAVPGTTVEQPSLKGSVSSPKLSRVQREVLERYAAHAPTHIAFGKLVTWWALIRKGLLSRSSGPGWIETDITDAGRSLLADETTGRCMPQDPSEDHP